MGVKLSNIAADSSKIEVPVADEKIKIEYYPGRITDDMFLMLSSFEGLSSEATAELNKALASFIKEWDLLEDDGVTSIPLTIEGLRRVYFPLKMLILGSIMRDIRPEALVPQVG